MLRFIARALIASTIAVAPVLAMAPSAHATDNACQNQSGDVDLFDTAGVDQYDAPTSGNGILAVCHPFPGDPNGTWSGVRVDQDSSGTCVAVIVAGTSYGCTASISGV
jgi:hypothetical protein